MKDQPKQIRVDAARNAKSILRAARRCFAERGADIPLEEIATAAGLGVATIYRHFGGRTSLTNAVFAHALRDLNAAIAEIGECPDPTEALRFCLLELFDRRAADRSLVEAIAGTNVSDTTLKRERANLKAQLNEIVDRAAVEKGLRHELKWEDILPLTSMVGTVADSFHEVGATSWHRYANLILNAVFDDDVISRERVTDLRVKPQSRSTTASTEIKG